MVMNGSWARNYFERICTCRHDTAKKHSMQSYPYLRRNIFIILVSSLLKNHNCPRSRSRLSAPRFQSPNWIYIISFISNFQLHDFLACIYLSSRAARPLELYSIQHGIERRVPLHTGPTQGKSVPSRWHFRFVPATHNGHVHFPHVFARSGRRNISGYCIHRVYSLPAFLRNAQYATV